MHLDSILIITLDNLGDTVMATAAISAAKSLFPQARIGVWVKSYAAGLFKNDPGVREHASDPFWDTSPGRGKGTLPGFLKTMREIREASYDAALVLNTEWRRSLAARLAGIPIRVGYARRSSSFFLTRAFPFQPDGRHIVGDHLALLSNWSGQLLSMDKHFPTLPVEKTAKKKVIVIHPFSGDRLRKNWPLEKWGELLKNLSRTAPAHSFAIVGAKNDQSEMDYLKQATSGKRLTLYIGRPLKDILHLLAEADLFVGGDSGPGHMAAAVGTPTLSLFGSFSPHRCRPIGKNETAVIQGDPIQTLPVTPVEKKILEMLK